MTARRLFWIASLTVWIACCILGTWGLSRARSWASEHKAAPATQAAWDQWRAEAARQADGEGPVQRRRPKSAEPPSVVLLRDYYSMCVAALVLFSGVLSFTFCYLVFGAFDGQHKHRRVPGGAADASAADRAAELADLG
jgi:hypothetical protein